MGYSSNDRVAVFNDTMEWIHSNPRLSSAVENSIRESRIYAQDEVIDINADQTYDTVITVTPHRSFEAACELLDSDPDSKVAVMNFANSIHPGGGVKVGARAQEECLCRTSTLFPVIDSPNLREYYDYHKRKHTPLASDTLIYSPNIVIFKSDTDLPQRLPEDQWHTVDVITVAAPDFRGKTTSYFPRIGDPGDRFITDENLYKLHVKRANQILSAAYNQGADTLVLGAFGCGAFENNPEIVAKAYKDALDNFPKVFKRIEFAVYCSAFDSANFKIFKETFE